MMLPDYRVRQRDYLLEISRALTEQLDLDKVLARILHASAELLAGAAGLIVLRDEGGGWSVAATYGIHPDFLTYFDPLLARIPEHGDPARFPLADVNRRLQRIARAASMGLLTSSGIPLIARGEVIGVIFIFRSYPGPFSANDQAVLQSFADHAAIAVQNARLYTQVVQEKHRLDAILDSSADGILILDSRQRILRFNPALRRLTGWPEETTLGQEHDQVVRWQRREPGLDLTQAAAGGWPLNSSATLYVEGDLLRKDGNTVSVGITYAPLTLDGKLVNIIANVRDITRFREAEELKSTFISIISHELKTPVALIKGFAGTLRRDDAVWDQATWDEGLRVIEEESDRLDDLIENLLDASRLQAGGIKLNPGEVDLPQLVRRLVGRFETQTDRHNFQIDFPPDFPVLEADEERLTQALSNLIGNAIKYSPDGGAIHIRGQTGEQDVMIGVSDQGKGIAPENRERVFDRFFREDTGLSRRTPGAGLGLFLARAVVEAHGGHLWATANPDRGTTFHFTLPVNRDT